MRYRLRCPDCAGKFLHEGEDFPRFCPLCGANCGADEDFVPSQVNIGTVKGQAGDIAFRAYEAASIARAEAAGDPSLKVTDMKDNLREGDVAAKVPQPSKEYTQAVEALGAQNWQGAPGGLSTADVVSLAKAGARQGTGAPVLGAIQGGKGVPVQAASASARGNWGGV